MTDIHPATRTRPPLRMPRGPAWSACCRRRAARGRRRCHAPSRPWPLEPRPRPPSSTARHRRRSGTTSGGPTARRTCPSSPRRATAGRAAAPDARSRHRGDSIACPGHYIGIEGGVARPLSVYGMAETYRCVEMQKHPAGWQRRYGSGNPIVWYALRCAPTSSTTTMTPSPTRWVPVSRSGVATERVSSSTVGPCPAHPLCSSNWVATSPLERRAHRSGS